MLLLYAERHKKHAKAAKRQDFDLIGCFVIPNSASNAIFLPNVIRYNAAATERFPDLARVIGKETTEELAQAIETLRAEVNNQSETKEFGISREDWDKNLDYIASNALADPCTGFNPRVPTVEELKAIYNACYEGVVYAEEVVA